MMRISIWHQFASNHSNEFSIVGTFETVEAAQKAYAELREMLREIAEWYHYNPLDYDLLSPAEEHFAQHFGVEWLSPLDCFDRSDPDAYVDMIYCLDTHILIASPFQPHSTGKPLADIMAKLGGQVIADLGDFSLTGIDVTLQCLAPDETIAQEIYEQVVEYFRYLRGISKIPPWIGYGENGRDPRTDAYIQAKQKVNARWQAESQFAAENRNLRLKIEKAYQQGQQELFSRLQTEYNELEKQVRSNLPEVNSAEWKLIMAMPDNVGAFGRWDESEMNPKELQRRGRQLSLGHICFVTSIVRGLPAILAWLKDLGCTEIQYTIAEYKW